VARRSRGGVVGLQAGCSGAEVAGLLAHSGPDTVDASCDVCQDTRCGEHVAAVRALPCIGKQWSGDSALAVRRMRSCSVLLGVRVVQVMCVGRLACL